MRWRYSTLYRIISFAYRAQLRKGFKRSSLCFEVFRRKVKTIADQVCHNIFYVTRSISQFHKYFIWTLDIQRWFSMFSWNLLEWINRRLIFSLSLSLYFWSVNTLPTTTLYFTLQVCLIIFMRISWGSPYEWTLCITWLLLSAGKEKLAEFPVIFNTSGSKTAIKILLGLGTSNSPLDSSLLGLFITKCLVSDFATFWIVNGHVPFEKWGAISTVVNVVFRS